MRTRKTGLLLMLLLLTGGFAGHAFADSPTCVSPETKLSWPAVNPVWEMCWLPPNLSVGADGSGMELRNVHFKGHLVMRRAHAPMLFAEYRTSTCYRDWKDTSEQFLSDRAVQNKLGTPVDPPAAITSCDRSNNPTAAYGNCPFQLPGYPNSLASCAKGLSIEDDGDHVTLTSQHSAAWYQYTTRWTFYADGRMNPEFGFGNNDGTNSGITHWHHNYWRMEFAIDDAGNTNPNKLSINGVDQSTEFSDLRDATGGPNGGPKTWEVRNATTGNGYRLVPSADDYTIPANESGRNFHLIDVMGTRQHNGEYADRSDNPLGVCAMNQDALVNNESLLNNPTALYYRVSVRDATANNWPPGCSGASCIPQDSMICKKRGPMLVPFGPWAGGGTTDPVASVTPASLGYKLTAGASGTDTLSIANGVVGSSLTYTITEAETTCANPSDVAWLSESPSSGSVVGGTSASVAVTANTSQLSVGSHSAKLCVATNDATHALVEVPVTLVVSAAPEPEASVTPSELSFNVQTGLNDSATLTIANSGTAGSTLHWTLAEAASTCNAPADVAWLNATPISGSAASGASNAVNVVVNTGSLQVGQYTAKLCASSDDMAHPLVEVPVTLLVRPLDLIYVDGFEVQGGPFTQPLQDASFEATTNDGGSNPSWSGADSNDASGTPFYSDGFGIPVYDGSWEAWFGGWGGGSAETQSFSQTVTIASGGSRYLNYWRLIDAPPGGNGRLVITLDAHEIANIGLSALPADDVFVPQSINISAYADNLAHAITFTFTHDGNGDDGNTFIDQVTIDDEVSPPHRTLPRAGHHDRRLTKRR